MTEKFKKILNPEKDKWIFANTIFWGIILWLIGYILGFIFYQFVPPDMIGYFIMPIGIALILWVLLKKIKRESIKDYFMLGVFWTAIAVIFDFLFIVLLLNSASYYKLDVYFYYILTFILPTLVGYYKLKIKND